MDNKNKPAMPSEFEYKEGNTTIHEINTGITKLEHFAGMAMQGLLSDSETGAFSNKKLVSCGVDIAELLIKELEGRKNES